MGMFHVKHRRESGGYASGGYTPRQSTRTLDTTRRCRPDWVAPHFLRCSRANEDALRRAQSADNGESCGRGPPACPERASPPGAGLRVRLGAPKAPTGARRQGAEVEGRDAETRRSAGNRMSHTPCSFTVQVHQASDARISSRSTDRHHDVSRETHQPRPRIVDHRLHPARRAQAAQSQRRLIVRRARPASHPCINAKA